MTPHHHSSGSNLRLDARGPRVAILVLGCRLTVYERCIRTIRATWGASSVENADIFYVYGAQGSASGGGASADMVDLERLLGRSTPVLSDGQAWVAGDVILCGAGDVREDQADCILRKRLIAFGYLAKQRSYDFVYTVCATSYVDLDGLKRHVRTLPATGVYQGALHVHEQTGYPFVSGASLLLSRDIALGLADNAGAILAAHPVTLPDDVAIGHFVASTYGGDSVAEIARRIGAGMKATDNQTFVVPPGDGSKDFVMAPAYSHAPSAPCYHYHFNSRRIWEMENFHRRFFATPGRPVGVAPHDT
jgi:hypothetical protein